MEKYGVFNGMVTRQTSGNASGNKNVFVKLKGKPAHIFPTNGMKVLNPFKGEAKAYAGDLLEYKVDGTGYLLKTYQVAAASNTAIVYVVRNGFAHVPFVGDVMMKGQDALSGIAAYSAVTAVEKTTDNGKDVYKLTLSKAIGTLAENDVLTEAKAIDVTDADVVLLTVGTEPATCAKGDMYCKSEDNKIYTATAANTWGSTGTTPDADNVYFSKSDNKTYHYVGSAMTQSDLGRQIVQNPNAINECDRDFMFEPATGNNDFDGARYYITPVLHEIMWIKEMQPMPSGVFAKNKSNIAGWFEL